MKKVLFIINRLLQQRSGKDVSQIISRHLDKNKFDYNICYSEFPGHATELSVSNRNKYDIIVAAGGDGTVNEVGKALAGSATTLGIIPLGSGNGLARTLKIPLTVTGSLQVLNECKIHLLDMGLINGKPFFNMAGIGFDANVAHNYAGKKKRGFFTYMQAVIEKIFVYEASVYSVKIESELKQIKAFLISFANSSQWGYNAHVCPGANPSDGILGITIIRDFPGIILPVLFLLLFTKKLYKSRYADVLEANHIEIEFPGEIMGHVDGNPVIFHDHIRVELVQSAIKIITA